MTSRGKGHGRCCFERLLNRLGGRGGSEVYGDGDDDGDEIDKTCGRLEHFDNVIQRFVLDFERND
jgi:hypothetical protein